MDSALFLKIANHWSLASRCSTLIFNLLTITQASAGVTTTLGFTSFAFATAVTMLNSHLLGFVTWAAADQARAVALDLAHAVFVFAGGAADEVIPAARRQVSRFDCQKLVTGRVDQGDQLAVPPVGREVDGGVLDPAPGALHDERVDALFCGQVI